MKKQIVALLLALVMMLCLCACGTKEETSDAQETKENVSETQESEDSGTIVVGISADLDSSLDPHVSSSSAGTREILFNIFEGLMKPDTEGNLCGAVAESYSVNEAADEYTFVLREGVKFHNGNTVTAADVVYSISRAAGLDTGEPLVSTLSNVVSVEATDEKTVVIRLASPDTEFIAYTTVAIIPDGNDPAEEMIGTGPFVFESRKAQESIELSRFDDYWGTPAVSEHITLKVVENGETMVMMLRSGAVDVAAHLESSQISELTDLTVLEGSMNLVQALYLNNAKAPFDDVRVRQALCYAIGKQDVIDLASDGHGFALGSSMYPAFGKYFDEELTDYYSTDLEKAKSLLAEAGYENGFSFTITVPSNYTPHVDAAQVIVNLLEQIGVTAEIEQVEWASWYSDVYQGRDFEATVCGMDASTLTASALLLRFTSDSAKNFIGFSNEEYDETYNKAVSTTDDAEQVEYFKQCERILTESAANVYIQDLADFVVMQKDVTGYRFYPLYVMDLSGIGRQ